MTPPTMVTVAAPESVDQAVVLRESLARFHPGWDSLLVLVDRTPDPSRSPWSPADDRASGFGEVIPASALAGERWVGWRTQHDSESMHLVLCIAAASHLMGRRGAGPVVCIEHETLVLGDLSPVVEALVHSSTVLVPRLLEPAPAGGSTVEDELVVLRTGTFAPGVLALSPAALDVVRWFLARLDVSDELAVPPGELEPRRLLDLVPTLFPNVAVLLNPGLAVTEGNVAARAIDLSVAGEYLVSGDQPLRTLRFADPDGDGPSSSARSDPANTHLAELWRYYLERLRTVREVRSTSAGDPGREGLT